MYETSIQVGGIPIRVRAADREFVGLLNALKVEGTTLVVAPGRDRNLALASRNVSRVEVATSDSLNTYQVLRFNKLIFTRVALEQIEQRLNANQAKAANE